VKPQRVYRTDIGALRPVERRADGTIVVDAFLSKCGVFPYVQRDGSIRRELRLPEDVFDQASLRSFEGVPVTNNHPPGMLDAKIARDYSVGAQLTVPVRDDGDHMRGRLAIHDHTAVSDMESGKVQVSNGYTCDTLEKPGVHPMYGPYDAIQKNIRGNHVAIVDRARAGVTAQARMDADQLEAAKLDGMMVLEPGTSIAIDATPRACKTGATMSLLPTARVEVVVKHDGEPSASAQVDPEDLAHRSGSGQNAAKPSKKEQPGEMADDGNDRARTRASDPDDDDDDEGDDEDAEDGAMYDSDGNLTETGERKVAASSFALPGKKKLPIHDPKAVKDSMRAFAKHEFDSPDEKHGAFNRIAGKGAQFGMDTSAFVKKHAGNLDRADGAHKDNAMTPQEIQALQEKATKRKEKLEAARVRIDSLETEKAALEGKIQNLTKELETAKAATRADAAEDPKKFQARVDAKVELVRQAAETGAKVDAKMTDGEIMRTVIKHVDGDDVPADKHDQYVQAVYEGAIKRAKKDKADEAKGAQALAATRQAVAGTQAAATDQARADADDTDEDAAKMRLRSVSATQWARKETK
jgi:hypothetical protein